MSYYYGSSPSSTSSSHSRGASYPSYSRPSSVSPQFANAYVYSSSARFNASRGFEPEDDMEFCPALTGRRGANGGVDGDGRLSSGHPDVSSAAYSSSGSPTATATTPVRIRKAIEIVNPETRMRVGQDS